MTIDCWVLSLHGKGRCARAGCCVVQCKEQRPERKSCCEERHLLGIWGVSTYNVPKFSGVATLL